MFTSVSRRKECKYNRIMYDLCDSNLFNRIASNSIRNHQIIFTCPHYSICLFFINAFLNRQFQTVTAGKFKRTLTPTKKITKEDLAKSEEDIAEIFDLFKGWVAQNRPQLNIDEVATGETWFGPAALEKGLCDEIKTVDDVLLEYISEGCNVYSVKYDPPPEVPSNLQALFALGDQTPNADSSIGRKAIRWLVRSFAEEVKAATTSMENTPLEQKYMAKDDTRDRVKASSDDSYYY